MDPPSAFGTFSAFPVETRLQIWNELLCKPVVVLMPLWFLRSRDGLYYSEPPKRSPFDVAIFRSSKACGLEAMEVFYAKNVFSFCALPCRGEFMCKNFHGNLTALQFILEFMIWTPLYPTKLAARHIKHVKLSICIPRPNFRFEWGYLMSDDSLCMTLMQKMQLSGGVRKSCFVDFLFFCNNEPPKFVQILGNSLFRGLKTLIAFEKVTINSSGYPRLVTYALHPNKPRPFYLDSRTNTPLKDYIMQKIVEELEPVLGTATVMDEYHSHIVEFYPRTRLAESSKLGSMLNE